MTRRIILHIGAPKCGSTYLQQVLLTNRALLAADGVNYPHDGTPHPGNGARIGRLSAGRLDALFETAHTVIFSHEDLYAKDWRGATLARLLATGTPTTEVTLITFLRPFSEVIFGDYSQFMKQFFDMYLARRQAYAGMTFETFAESRVRKIKPATYVARWCRRLGVTAPVVASHGAIREVMEPILGTGGLNWDIPPERTNPSLRMEDCDRLATALNDPSVATDDLRVMLTDAYQNIGQPDAGRSETRRAFVSQIFKRQIAMLARQYSFNASG